MQLIRMVTIAVLTGIFAAGLVWLLWDLVHKLRSGSAAHDNDEK